MTAWSRSLSLLVVAALVVAAVGVTALPTGAQSTPSIQVGASSSLTAVTLFGETLREDPDVAANRPDADGLTHVASGTTLRVQTDVTAPYAGTFYVCTYPWVTTTLTSDYQCDNGAFYSANQRMVSSADVYLDPFYSEGQYKFYVYLWEWTSTGFQAVDYVWFTVAVDRAPSDTTPVPTQSDPGTIDQPPAATPEPRVTSDGTGGDGGDGTGGDGSDGTGGDGADGTGGDGSDGAGGDGSAGGGDGGDAVDGAVDRGDVFSPRNVGLMMLFLAAASLLVQLLRGP